MSEPVAFLCYYRCRKCKAEWKERTTEVICPAKNCGHIYVDWINWPKIEAKLIKEGARHGSS